MIDFTFSFAAGKVVVVIVVVMSSLSLCVMITRLSVRYVSLCGGWCSSEMIGTTTITTITTTSNTITKPWWRLAED